MAQLKDLLVMGPARFLQKAYIGSSDSYGSAAQPIYWNDGVPTATTCSLSATVNSATQWGVAYYSTTTNLTSTAAGAANTALMGKGSAAPAFVSVSTTLATSTAATASASQKLKVTVLGVASSEVELSKATTALYGTTKLTDAYTSTDATLAATGKSILAAIQTLDVSAVGVAAATGNRFISQISEADGKISATLATATIGSTTKPIWIDGGTIKAGSYELKATVNEGAANRAAYYSGTNAISQASSIYMTTTELAVNKTSITSGYKFEVSGKTILDNTTAASATNSSSQLSVANTSGGAVAIELWRNANASWQICNDSGTLYIRNNYSTAKQSTYSQNALTIDYNTGNTSVAGTLSVGQTSRNTDYKLYVNGAQGITSTTAISGGASADRTGSLVTAGGIHLDGGLKVGKWTNTSTAPGVGVRIHDLRDITDNANKFGDQAVNWYFDQINGSWASIMSMKGWTGTYYAWELGGNAHSSSIDRYYVRTMTGTTAGTWHTLTYLPAFAAVGSSTQPVYVDANGCITATTYALSATINAGTQNRMAYYSGANAISAAANHTYGATTYTITNSAGGTDTFFKAVGSQHTLSFGIGTGNVNRGIYDTANNSWGLSWDASAGYMRPGTYWRQWGKNTTYASMGGAQSDPDTSENWAQLGLGNSTAVGTAQNYSGRIRWYNSNGSSTSWYARYGTLGTTANQNYVQMEQVIASKIGFGTNSSNTTTYGSTTQPIYWNNGVPAAMSGALAVGYGGTGLTSSPSLLVNLASTAAAAVFAAEPRPGITGNLPVGHGGTGADNVTNARANLEISKTDLVNELYPVGSIYISTSSTNPGAADGVFKIGTWEQIQGKFLLGAGTWTDGNGTTKTFDGSSSGGEFEHTLTVDEIPSHRHYNTQSVHYYVNGTGSSGLTTSGKNTSMSQAYVSYTGGDGAHNNMPPYFAVYIWQRTA